MTGVQTCALPICGSLARAVARLEAARPALAKERSPLSGWAVYWSAFCRYQRAEYDQALRALLPLAAAAERDGDASLHGKALSLIGLIQLIDGSATASLTSFESAVRDFSARRETANAAKATALVASDLEHLGRRVEAWRRLHGALLVTTPGEPLIRYGVCEVAAVLSLEDGQASIALWFQDEVVESALAAGRDFAAAEASDLAFVLVHAGDLVAEICKTGAGHQPHIARANHGNSHSLSDFLLVDLMPFAESIEM